MLTVTVNLPKSQAMHNIIVRFAQNIIENGARRECIYYWISNTKTAWRQKRKNTRNTPATSGVRNRRGDAQLFAGLTAKNKKPTVQMGWVWPGVVDWFGRPSRAQPTLVVLFLIFLASFTRCTAIIILHTYCCSAHLNIIIRFYTRHCNCARTKCEIVWTGKIIKIQN